MKYHIKSRYKKNGYIETFVLAIVIFAVLLVGGLEISNTRGNIAETLITPAAHPTINITIPSAFPSTLPHPSVSLGSSSGFITRSGSTLYFNGKPFRFAGANAHWLGLLGSGMPPSTSQVDAAFASASFLHATVIRSHTLGISTGCATCLETGLNNFNTQAFQSIDYAIKAARDHNIHLLIPLTDNYNYYHGGEHNFTDWRGVPVSQFYTNQTVIQDFKNYIAHLLNHTNQYTGIALKDDPTIMAWETGNEIWTAPAAWTEMIAQFIKGIAPYQLVADGHHANYASDIPIADLQQEPDIDMYTSHYYHTTDTTYISRMKTSANLAKQNNKVYFIGEYDWTSTSGTTTDLANYLSTIENSSISGDMFWDLYPSGLNGDQFTLHYPGDTTDMKARDILLSNHAGTM